MRYSIYVCKHPGCTAREEPGVGQLFYTNKSKTLCKIHLAAQQRSKREAARRAKEAEAVYAPVESAQDAVDKIQAWRAEALSALRKGGGEEKNDGNGNDGDKGDPNDTSNTSKATNMHRTLRTLQSAEALDVELRCTSKDVPNLRLRFPSDEVRRATIEAVRALQSAFQRENRDAEAENALKRKQYAEMSPQAKRDKRRRDEQNRGAKAEERHAQGERKCRGLYCCSRVLPLAQFTYAPADAGVADHRDADLAREHPVCAECFPEHLARQRAHEAQRPDRSEQMREYERRPEVKKMRRAWAEANPDCLKIYQRRFYEKNKDRILPVQREFLRAYRKTDQYKRYKSLWNTQLIQALSHYPSRAKSQGIEWTLSRDEAETLMTAPECYYCGTPNGTPDEEGVATLLIGIDRVDPTGGYTLENVVPCCHQCNFSKNILAVEDFVQECMNVTEYQRNGKIAERPVLFYHSHDHARAGHHSQAMDFKRYGYEAKQRKIDFELSESTFTSIVSDPCHYCGTMHVSRGIDRVDSGGAYVIDNCVSSCTLCNMCKNRWPKDAFIDMAARVAARHGVVTSTHAQK